MLHSQTQEHNKIHNISFPQKDLDQETKEIALKRLISSYGYLIFGLIVQWDPCFVTRLFMPCHFFNTHVFRIKTISSKKAIRQLLFINVTILHSFTSSLIILLFDKHFEFGWLTYDFRSINDLIYIKIYVWLYH